MFAKAATSRKKYGGFHRTFTPFLGKSSSHLSSTFPRHLAELRVTCCCGHTRPLHTPYQEAACISGGGSHICEELCMCLFTRRVCRGFPHLKKLVVVSSCTKSRPSQNLVLGAMRVRRAVVNGQALESRVTPDKTLQQQIYVVVALFGPHAVQYSAWGCAPPQGRDASAVLEQRERTETERRAWCRIALASNDRERERAARKQIHSTCLRTGGRLCCLCVIEAPAPSAPDEGVPQPTEDGRASCEIILVLFVWADNLRRSISASHVFFGDRISPQKPLNRAESRGRYMQAGEMRQARL